MRGLSKELNYQELSLETGTGTRTHKDLVCKLTINHLANLAKWLSFRLQTKGLWVRYPLQSPKFQISHLF